MSGHSLRAAPLENGAFTGCSQDGHAHVTGFSAETAIFESQHGDRLGRRSGGDPAGPAGGPAAGVRCGGGWPGPRPHRPRAPAAHGARPPARPDRDPAGALHGGLAAAVSPSRAIRGRVREAAASQARGGVTWFGAHPYPLRVRIPPLPLGFTAFSHRRHRSITDSAVAHGSLGAARPNEEGRPLRSRILFALAASAVLALAVAACGSSKKSSNASPTTSGGGTVNGAGSTFAAPIYSQWGNALKGQGLTVNYQPVGSGAGVAQFAAGTVDFGASAPALTPADRTTIKKGEAVQIPMAFGAITVSYNGAPKGLKLDGATIADIFLGKVKTWNDPAITKLNPGLKLPPGAITVIHRSDESGTTKGFTTFLSDYSPEWKSKVGADKTVKWPTGTGAKGNDGVAAAVKQQSGAVGYVEEAYALQNNFTTAAVKNKAGKFVEPTLATTTAAGQGVKVPKDLGLSVIDSPNAG